MKLSSWLQCRTTRRRLSAYCDGELPPSQADAVRAHLGCCPSCAAEARDLAEMIDAAHRVGDELAPLPRLGWEDLRARLDTPVPVRPARARLALPAAAAVALALAVTYALRPPQPTAGGGTEVARGAGAHTLATGPGPTEPTSAEPASSTVREAAAPPRTETTLPGRTTIAAAGSGDARRGAARSGMPSGAAGSGTRRSRPGTGAHRRTYRPRRPVAAVRTPVARPATGDPLLVDVEDLRVDYYALPELPPAHDGREKEFVLRQATPSAAPTRWTL